MIFYYQFILLSVIILFLPAITFLIYFSPGSRYGLAQRLAVYPPETKKKLKQRNGSVWVHAASVGEVNLLKNIPGFPFPNTLITCTSITGREIAKKMFPSAQILLIPIDSVWLVKKLKRLINPKKALVIETELWPAFIYALKDREISIINGRLSAKKFPLYLVFRRGFRKLFKWIKRVYVIDNEDFDRFRRLGMPEEKIKVSGNLKYNFEPPRIDYSDMRYNKPDHPVLICGSTHNREEGMILDIFKDLKKNFPGLALIISPRHLERIKDVSELLAGNGIEFVLWSGKSDPVKPGEVILVDTMGELAKIYSVSSIAFIGGSLVPVGGHNIIEAAIWKIPVVTGPYFHNFENMVNRFACGGGLRVAKNPKDLYNFLKGMLADEGLLKDMGEKNYNLTLQKKKEIEETFRDLKI
jgi:3-deoxy-D-manno-octulosonic-acid transferase